MRDLESICEHDPLVTEANQIYDPFRAPTFGLRLTAASQKRSYDSDADRRVAESYWKINDGHRIAVCRHCMCLYLMEKT